MSQARRTRHFARGAKRVRDEGRRKIKRLLPVHCPWLFPRSLHEPCVPISLNWLIDHSLFWYVCLEQNNRPAFILLTMLLHPRRPRGSQPGREKRRDESFQVRVKEPLGSGSHRTISKNSSGCRALIGHKKCFVLLCPIGEQFLLSSFREFVHDGYCLATLAQFVHQACACKGNFYFLLS